MTCRGCVSCAHLATFSTGLFPAATTSWKAFQQVKKLLAKSSGKIVADVMTRNPTVARATTNLVRRWGELKPASRSG